MKRTANLIAVAALSAAAALASGVAGATEGGMRTRECVYDYSMMTDHECRVYRMKVLKAKSSDERVALQEELRRVMDARARERGVSTGDRRGLHIAPVANAR